jgi:hypothetical protein
MYQNQVYKVKTLPEVTQYCPDSDYTLFAQKLKTTLVTSSSNTITAHAHSAQITTVVW